MADVFIVDYLRSPFTPATRGELARTRPDDLLAEVLRAIVAHAGIDPAAVEDVIVGCAFPEAEQGLNIGRCAARIAGLPESVGGCTINRWCGSSMQAVQMAGGAIAMGAGDLFIAAGVEAMSRVPMMGFNPMPNPAWDDHTRAVFLNMGLTAEILAERFGIGREEQDRYALMSQTRAAAARGTLEEIVAVAGVASDGCIRPETSIDKLATLKTPFRDNGTVTAGNASPLTDGATAVLVASEAAIARFGLRPRARIAGYATAGCAPEVMGIGPVPATRKALERANINASRLDVIEMNEAFAVQVLACCRELDIEPERLNRQGGAIALGHPLGATGARLVGQASAQLAAQPGRWGLATQCIGGGQGVAMVLEAA